MITVEVEESRSRVHATSLVALPVSPRWNADRYHAAPELWIIEVLIDVIVAGRARRYRGSGAVGPGEEHCGPAAGRGCRMAAMKPRTGDGPLEVTKEGRGIVMRVPLEGGGRLVVELSAIEAAALGEALKSAVG